MRSVEDLAAATGSHAPTLRRLLRALATFDVVVDAPDGRFALGPLGLPLVEGPGSTRGLVVWWGHEDSRRTWDAQEDCVRNGETEVGIEVAPFHWTVFGLVGYVSIRVSSRSAS